MGGGMRLNPGKTWTLKVPTDPFRGHVWARTGCSFDHKGNGLCQTGDCGGLLACMSDGMPPFTTANFSLNQYDNHSFFDISLYQGFNVPMEFLPIQGYGQVVTRMRGTPGYLAPGWLTSHITKKADVYSFGVVVMEIVSGRKNLDTSRSGESLHLIMLLEEKVKNDDLVDLIDKNSNDMQAHKQDVVQMMKLAMWCLQIDYQRRPKMSEVVKVLEGSMDAESNIDHNFVATNEPNFGIAGNVNSSAPPVASDISGPR
ncbi:hypothetical protein ACQ4PT_022628 [Festuca glaucescens]